MIYGQYLALLFTVFFNEYGYLKMPFRSLQHTLNSKIQRASCPPKVVVHNPCLEYIKYIILPWFGNLEVVQNEWNGSTK